MATSATAPKQILIANRNAGSNTANRNNTAPPLHKDRDIKLKVVVRRLAPGLTEDEFQRALGEQWKVGVGKVDWFSYQKGKIAKDSAKPSYPSRAYMHLTDAQWLGPLADKVKSTQFVDARNSFNDPVLLGPPILVFSSYAKVPGKGKPDIRQGTIDQDPEFIDFLTELTAPVVKPANVDQIVDKDPKDVKTVTPLVQYIKDKKANKGKDKKHARQESKDNQAKAEEKKIAAKGGRNKAVIGDKKGANQTFSKAEKPKDIGVNPVAAISKTTGPSTPTAVQPALQPAPQPIVASAKTAAPGTNQKQERRRERGNASIAAKILQRDLGLAPGGGARRKRDNPPVTNGSAAQSPTVAPIIPVQQAPVASQPIPTVAAVPVQIQQTTVDPKAPIQDPTPPATPRSQPQVASAATQAFLKHANPSQGVTEPLLEEAFKVFGTVTKVQIDKRKGFAYIDFAEPATLQKAIAASPVKVAQGQVQVLERMTGSSLQNRNARGTTGQHNQAANSNRGGRGGRGRGGRNVMNSSKTPNTAPATPTTSATVTDPVNAPT